MRALVGALLVTAVLSAAGCGSQNDGDAQAEGPVETAGDGLYPDIVSADATLDADGTWTFTVTMSSPYDAPERYADAWRVISENGGEIDVRELTHDHASEQPFTRSLTGVEIDENVSLVIVEGRDQVNGWGGGTVTVELARP